ncbi:MAG: hypothetical protein KDI46_01710 [Alphaproteobacteria bacterium]|nr:hypothetical protein [Alphaproteobacteria bacterium]
MKHSLKLLSLSVAVLGLAACETGMGYYDNAPPYDMERTAQHASHATPAAEPQTMEEPMACQCDCSAWEKRALQAESDLAICQEAGARVRDAFRNELKK